MHKPYFSVIIPTYHQSEYISESIDAILNQTFEDFEVIISDDSENEETQIIVQKFNDNRIRYFKNKKRLGRVKNYRTSVLERAKGMYVMVCDGDDVLTDMDYLKTIYEISKNDSSIVFFQAGKRKGVSLDDSIEMLPVINENILVIDGLDYIEKFLSISHFSHGTTISKLDMLKKSKPYSLDIISSDINTFLKLASFGKVCLIKKSVLFWRQHGMNASATSNWFVKIHNLIWIDDLFKRLKEQNVDRDLSQLKKLYHLFFYKMYYEQILLDFKNKNTVLNLIFMGVHSVIVGKSSILLDKTKYKQILVRKLGLSLFWNKVSKVL